MSLMRVHEAIRAATFLGMKREAADIVDYIAIRASLLVSVLTGMALGIWLGMARGAWPGVLLGTASYAVSMRICMLLFFPGRSQN